MNFVWDSSYSVGVTQIDAEHKTLFGIMRDLSDALRRGEVHGRIADILARLAEYTHYHFQSEEQLMLQHDYPGTELHKQQHDAFKRELAELILRHREGEYMVNIDTYTALRDWLLRHVTDHTQGPDQLLGKFIQTGEYEEPPEELTSPL